MPEIRIDPLSGERTIVAGDRAVRPGGELAVSPAPPINPSADPFAEGNEALTPPEIYAVRDGGGAADTPGWRVRVVPNLYPALTPDAEPRTSEELFWRAPALGNHEVIVNAPDPVTSLAELEIEQVACAVDVWRERMQAHRDRAYVHLIVNERREAGASREHTHAQLYALDFVPAALARERERFGAYATRTMGGNLLADLVQQEVRRRERIVAIDEETVLMAPYGGRVPFQLMIAPRTPRLRFEDEGPTGASMLHRALSLLRRRFETNPPLNLWVRTAPSGAEHFSWRIDILPRLTKLAGLELGAGVHLNIVAPETAAAELRGL